MKSLVPYKRSDRVSPLIKKELSLLFQFDIKDPRLANLSISKVIVSDDLRHAKIFYSLYVPTVDQKEIDSGLKTAIGFLRRELKKRLRLRIIPELVFFRDDSVDYSMKIESILKGLKES